MIYNAYYTRFASLQLRAKATHLPQKIANTRQTKSFKPFFALAESLPTFATLIHSEHQCARMVTRIRHYESYDKSVRNCCNLAPLSYKGEPDVARGRFSDIQGLRVCGI